jgi:hypothetical protein
MTTTNHSNKFFSDKYVKYYTNEEDESNLFNIKNKVLDYDSKLAHQWNNIALTILFDIDCNKNPILSKIKDDCFNIEKIIQIDNFTDENTKNNIIYPSEYYIINYLLPKLDSLSLNEIEMLKKAQMIKDGPLYEKFKYMRIPYIFIDLFS